MNIKLLGNRVIIEPDLKEERSASGLVISKTTDQSDFAKGTVAYVGKGKSTDYGYYQKTSVEVGDKVIYQYGTVIHLEGKAYMLVNDSDIIAVY